jgi:hypothetical protein
MIPSSCQSSNHGVWWRSWRPPAVLRKCAKLPTRFLPSLHMRDSSHLASSSYFGTGQLSAVTGRPKTIADISRPVLLTRQELTLQSSPPTSVLLKPTSWSSITIECRCKMAPISDISPTAPVVPPPHTHSAAYSSVSQTSPDPRGPLAACRDHTGASPACLPTYTVSATYQQSLPLLTTLQLDGSSRSILWTNKGASNDNGNATSPGVAASANPTKVVQTAFLLKLFKSVESNNARPC